MNIAINSVDALIVHLGAPFHLERGVLVTGSMFLSTLTIEVLHTRPAKATSIEWIDTPTEVKDKRFPSQPKLHLC